MVRIGAGGKTAQTIGKDDSGAPFIGPNAIAPDGNEGRTSPRTRSTSPP
ncbi:MAG TPA: hypothetical protein VNB28_03820 [Methylomirabilota bacterium]|jgi:hypothetical protein|nr:hypothetical protein [Methylomirabilota bacterium]